MSVNHEIRSSICSSYDCENNIVDIFHLFLIILFKFYEGYEYCYIAFFVPCRYYLQIVPLHIHEKIVVLDFKGKRGTY